MQRGRAATAAARHDGDGRRSSAAALMAKRPDWSRPLPAPLQILDEHDKPILTLATVGDVRDLIVKRLPEESWQKETWQYVAGIALDAANGGNAADLSIALRMVLSLEGIACLPR
jgi:hypothetical protein